MRPSCNARTPNSTACSDDAQAELTAMNGPFSPKALEIVPATMLMATSGESSAPLGDSARTVSHHFANDRFLVVPSATAAKPGTSRRNCAASSMQVP